MHSHDENESALQGTETAVSEHPLVLEPNELQRFHARLYQLSPRLVVTPLLVAFNIIVFGAMVASGVDFMTPTISHLLEWGANYGPKTSSGESWRLWSSNYIHIGIIHIAFNMWVLSDVGRLVERLTGSFGFLVTYTVSGIVGGLATFFTNPGVVSAGASGAVFGIYGCLLGYLALSRGHVPGEALKQISKNGGIFIGFNILYGATQADIDMAAHLGGLGAGFVCGLAFALPLNPSGVAKRFSRSLAVLSIGALSIGSILAEGVQPIPDLQKALERFERVEPLVLGVLKDAAGRAQKGEITDAQFAGIIETKVLTPWQQVRAELEPIEGYNSRQKKIVTLVKRYMKAKESSFKALVRFAHTGDETILQEVKRTGAEADKIISEIKALK